MNILTSLSKLLLPAEVFDYFTITSVSDHRDEVELFLEEKDVQEIRIKRRWEAIDADNKSFGRSNPHVVASRHCERKRSNL